MIKKLSVEEIRFIDTYLIDNKIKYIDVRLELIDHLATDFEENSNNHLLEDFLKSKKQFSDSFVKTRQKTIHWSYQKSLWKRFLMFFYKPKYIMVSLILTGLIHFSISRFSEIMVQGTFIFSLFILYLLPYFFHLNLHFNKVFKKIQSVNSILAIMSLPSFFLYIIPFIKEFLFANFYLFFGYWFVAIVLGISGLIEVYNREKELLEKYSSLIKD